jgi:hypothetical protein
MSVKSRPSYVIQSAKYVITFFAMDVKEAGRRGGKRRAKTLTKKRRVEIATNAVKARWAKEHKRHGDK